jgi:uncharacterized membrane protein
MAFGHRPEIAPMPSESALEQSRRCQLAPISYEQPFLWLARGWHDLLAAPVPGLLHGLAVTSFGLLLLLLAYRQFWLLAGAFSGFLLIGPLAATGLYAVSRALEAQHNPAHCAGRVEAARPPVGTVRPAAGRCRHLLGVDLGVDDHGLRARGSE